MKKISMLFALVVALSLQGLYAQRVITGNITSEEDGLALPGAAVIVKGTTIGSITDLDGNYTITVPDDAEVLSFSFVGLLTQDIPLGDQEVIDVVLAPDVVGIEEVMVVAYRTVKKADYTGSARVVDGEKLVVPGAESVEKSLSGKVSGVRVTSSTGDPGSSGEIQIRGIGSINGSTSPLYVIDGIPMATGNIGHYEKSSNILSTLNPDDIENMTVLKDAAAASLYGSRAANGVVIITTKKGKEGKTKFDFKANLGIASMASKSYEMMSGDAYYEYEMLAFENKILDDNQLLPGQANYGNEGLLNSLQPIIAATQEASRTSWDPVNNTNWRDFVYRTGKQQEYQLSASGGSENTQFYISGNYSDIEGIVNASDFQRYSGRVNINNKATKWLNLGINQMLSYTRQKGYRDHTSMIETGMGSSSPVGILMGANPTAPEYDENGNTYPEANFRGLGHPEDLLDGTLEFINTNTYRSLTNGFLQVNFTPNIHFKSTVGLDFVQAQNQEYWSPNSIDGRVINGLGWRDALTNIDITTSNIISINKVAGPHNISIIGGFEASNKSIKYLQASADQYSNEKLYELANGQPKGAFSSFADDALLSYLANLNYDLMGRYIVTGSIRTDGSSRLGVNNRWASFWSGSLAWRFSNEEFLSGLGWLSDGKLRFSYGTNGNLPPDLYMHMPLYNLEGGYGDYSAIYVSNPGNNELGWEKSNNMNIGIDLTLFERFSLIVEYYSKNTEGLLLNVPISYITGFASTWQNTGKLLNNGIDFEFHSVNLPATSTLKWRTDFTLSTQKSIVTELPNDEDIVAGDFDLYLYSSDDDLYSFYLPTWTGVDPESGLSYFLIDPEAPDTPENRTRNHSEASRSIVAKAYPDIIGGLSNTFGYKGLELDILFTYSFGGNMFDYPGYFSHHDGGRIGILNLAKDVENNYWKETGDEVDNPRPIFQDENRSDLWSSRYILSTDHVRLKDLTLSYSLPGTAAERIRMDNIRLYLRGTNLWMWAKEDGIDPEITLTGFRTTDTPPTRVLSIGFQFSF
jgi:TonB-linked SusC/RagA family outer membrane protein